jgi:formamidopyrimidine-DNA glycosylase
MPELAELKIMADYINQNVKDKLFNKSFHVLKGNNPDQFHLLDEFKIDAESFGKELIIRFYNGFEIHKISVFMGMSGNWFSSFYENIKLNISKKAFDKPICEALLNQEYFNGIGNYLRSTILYYLDVNPFEEARKVIKDNPKILSMCRDIPIMAYNLNGGQLQDWINPFDTDYEEFQKWVFYQKGLSCKDINGRTFWFDEKWKDFCPYSTNDKKIIKVINGK